MKIPLFALTSIAAATVSCVDKDTYYGIDHAVETIAAGITDEDKLVHFFGGIVRLATHNFMDFSRHEGIKMGSDGCIKWDHQDNKGLYLVRRRKPCQFLDYICKCRNSSAIRRQITQFD